MTVTINGTTGVSGVAGSASTPALIGSDADSGYYINSANEPNASVNGTAVWNAASTFGFKNRLINGRMEIDQRNAGASVTPTTNGTYLLDRWQFGLNNASKYSVQQSSTAPAGFSNSILVTSLAATSVAAGDYYSLLQPIEGFNTADFNFGTANAVTITVSFWVRCSLTGTFGGWVQNANVDRSYPFSYTISAANTWEKKTITIAGDTTGTWVGATNGVGLYLGFSLGMGSTRQGTANTWAAANYRSVTGETPVVGTNGATFYITGVQLEKGSTATSFDYRPYGTELQLCQRYYEKSYNIDVAPNTNTSVGQFSGSGLATATTLIDLGNQIKYVVTKRTTPTTITTYLQTGSASTWDVYGAGAGTTKTPTIQYSGADGFGWYITGLSGLTTNNFYAVKGHWTAEAEL